MEVVLAIIRTIVLEFPFPLMVAKTAVLWMAAATGAFCKLRIYSNEQE